MIVSPRFRNRIVRRRRDVPIVIPPAPPPPGSYDYYNLSGLEIAKDEFLYADTAALRVQLNTALLLSTQYQGVTPGTETFVDLDATNLWNGHTTAKIKHPANSASTCQPKVNLMASRNGGGLRNNIWMRWWERYEPGFDVYGNMDQGTGIGILSSGSTASGLSAINIAGTGGAAFSGTIAQGATFTVAGETGAPVHTVTNGPIVLANQTAPVSVAFTPALASTIATGTLITFATGTVTGALGTATGAWTTIAPQAGTSFKRMFLEWDANSRRGEIEYIGAGIWVAAGASDNGAGTEFPPGATAAGSGTPPNPMNNQGSEPSVDTAWSDGLWRDWIVHFSAIYPTARYRIWRGLAGQVPTKIFDQSRTIVRLAYPYTDPMVHKVWILGANRNRKTAVLNSYNVGAWGIVDGNAHDNPYNLPADHL